MHKVHRSFRQLHDKYENRVVLPV